MFRHMRKQGCSSRKNRREWQYYSLKGNEYYFKSEYKEAAYCYSISVERLEPMVSDACLKCVDSDCLQHYLIACQNTSHAFSMEGDIKKAELFLSRAHFKLLSLVTSSVAKSEDWQSLVSRICERSLDALTQFLERQGRKGVADSILFESQRLLA